MDAREPGELPLVFQHYLNIGDLDGLMAHYYAEGAVYVSVPGVTVSSGRQTGDRASRGAR